MENDSNPPTTVLDLDGIRVDEIVSASVGEMDNTREKVCFTK